MKEINDAAIVEFIEKVFNYENIYFHINNYFGPGLRSDFNDDLTVLIKCNVPYKEDINIALDKCVLLNTYLNDYFKNDNLISSYYIYYYIKCYQNNEEYYNNEYNIKQNILKDINNNCNRYLSNTLYINDLVKINIIDGPKIKEEDKQGDYYIYDYYFTKLSKDLRKESEE